MKKFIVVAVIILSFLLGNVSMLLGLIKLIGESAFAAMAKDGIVQWVMQWLYPAGSEERLPGSARPFRGLDYSSLVEQGGPILTPRPGMPRQR